MTPLAEDGLDMEVTMRSATEMRGVIEAWESSDLTQREFAEQEGMSYTAFQYWRRRLKELDEESEVEIVPLRIVDDDRAYVSGHPIWPSLDRLARALR